MSGSKKGTAPRCTMLARSAEIAALGQKQIIMNRDTEAHSGERLVHVAVGPATLEGNLHVPSNARGIVLFAHGCARSGKRERGTAFS